MALIFQILFSLLLVWLLLWLFAALFLKNRVNDSAVVWALLCCALCNASPVFSLSSRARVGSDRMDAIVEQLVASAPLNQPLKSLLIDGSWVKQGVWSSITHVVSIKEWAEGEPGPTVATFRYLLKGLVAVRMAQPQQAIERASENKRRKQVELSVQMVPAIPLTPRPYSHRTLSSSHPSPAAR
jgi:hypothetical protein